MTRKELIGLIKGLSYIPVIENYTDNQLRSIAQKLISEQKIKAIEKNQKKNDPVMEKRSLK